MLTADILRKIFKKDEAYIARFSQMQDRTTITLDPFLLGTQYSTVPYSEVEKDAIIEILQFLVAQQFDNIEPSTEKTYTARAGAPGTGKKALEQLFDIDVANKKFPDNAIYIGPDSVVLAQMPTYKRDCKDDSIGPTASYEKWRDASNFIANFMMIKAMTEGTSLVHDATLTHKKSTNILDVLGAEGYQRRVHFFYADKESREESLKYREKTLGHNVELKADDKKSTKADASFERLADDKFFKSRVELMIIYFQAGEYYLGKGEVMPFAIFNKYENDNITILSECDSYVKRLLDEIENKENLSADLKAKVRAAIATWVKLPKVKNIATLSL